MGKKEQLEELDNQLIKAKKKISDGNFNIGTSAVLFLIGFLNEINYEKANLK